MSVRNAPSGFSAQLYMVARIVNLGAGQNSIYSCKSIWSRRPLHFSARVTDATSQRETATSLDYNFQQFNRHQTGDWLDGYAVTRTHAIGVAEYDYPIQGINYGPGPGLEALLRISIDVVPTTEEATAGMDWMELDLSPV